MTGGGDIEMTKVTLVDPVAVVAVSVTLLVPISVGVPEIRPVALSMVSPDGKPLAE
jgi:hypothetical protein